MSIVIELDPAAEAALEKHAAAVSMETKQYISYWVGVLANHPEWVKTLGETHEQGKQDAALSRALQIEAMRQDIAEFGKKHKLRALPDEDVTREAIYQDHD